MENVWLQRSECLVFGLICKSGSIKTQLVKTLLLNAPSVKISAKPYIKLLFCQRISRTSSRSSSITENYFALQMCKVDDVFACFDQPAIQRVLNCLLIGTLRNKIIGILEIKKFSPMGLRLHRFDKHPWWNRWKEIEILDSLVVLHWRRRVIAKAGRKSQSNLRYDGTTSWGPIRTSQVLL